MEKLTIGRELIKKAVHMTTIISKDKTYEDRLWKLACDYVRKAKEVIPESTWSSLSEFEQRVLRNGVPDRVELCFFNENETEEGTYNNSDANYPPKPSTWDSIHRAALSIQEENQELTRRIYTLEREKSNLESYKEQSKELRAKYEQLDESHDSYRRRVQDEQQTLHNQMRHMMEELSAATEHKEEAYFLSKELEKMREKMAAIQRNNYEEMNRLRVEIDSINYERESISSKLEESQSKLMDRMNEIEGLKQQIKKYQEMFMFVLPTIPDDIQQQLSELL